MGDTPSGSDMLSLIVCLAVLHPLEKLGRCRNTTTLATDFFKPVESFQSGLSAQNPQWWLPARAQETPAKMPSQMEHAMETLMFTFHKYAGDKNYLTKEDLRVLMDKEFPGFLDNQKDPMAVDKIMKDLDQCRDGRVGFQSFFSLVAGLTIACNDYFVVHMKQKGRK
ncbi:hypothetical protein KIL84_005988 [Mauremys mutica]|uniref:Protein S100-A10 n=6 Tax=Testudinoidea TaxID=8486 RepID=A0A9D4B3A4_9SAUR|nr:hypothetical protein KIL84_005988 [Mauremys mutica]